MYHTKTYCFLPLAKAKFSFSCNQELAELVHKVNLLCLLGRGRLFDIACNDSLIQVTLLYWFFI